MRIAAFVIFFLGMVGAQALAADVAGSADYPDIGRYEGASITRYQAKDFDEYWLATGPVRARERGQGATHEGRVIRIGYRTPAGPSVLEVARNYENRLRDNGYEIIYQCRDKECGGYNFRYFGTEILPAPAMTVNLGDFRYIAAVKRGAPTVHAAILVSINNGAILNQVMIVETDAMKNRMVNAENMADAISQTGKVALYDILFDHDEASIRPDSRPQLDQIARFLTDNPNLNVMIVGHTDNRGTPGYNLDLSQRRARSVAERLALEYAIKPARLLAVGVGMAAPVATNHTEAGRAQNRRVELVER